LTRRDSSPNHNILFNTRTKQALEKGQTWIRETYFDHELVLGIIKDQFPTLTKGAPHSVRLQRALIDSVTDHPELGISQTVFNAVKSIKETGASQFTILGLVDGKISGVCAGESKLIVIRKGATVFQSPKATHSFKEPVTSFEVFLGWGDMVEEFEFQLDEGDFIVFGSEGFWDNVDIERIEDVVDRSIRGCANYDEQIGAQRNSRARMNVVFRRVTAALTRLATRGMNNKRWMSPYAEEAVSNGRDVKGGRLDSYTIILAILIDRTTRDVPAVWSLATLDARVT